MQSRRRFLIRFPHGRFLKRGSASIRETEARGREHVGIPCQRRLIAAAPEPSSRIGLREDHRWNEKGHVSCYRPECLSGETVRSSLEL